MGVWVVLFSLARVEMVDDGSTRRQCVRVVGVKLTFCVDLKQGFERDSFEPGLNLGESTID